MSERRYGRHATTCVVACAVGLLGTARLARAIPTGASQITRPATAWVRGSLHRESRRVRIEDARAPAVTIRAVSRSTPRRSSSARKGGSESPGSGRHDARCIGVHLEGTLDGSRGDGRGRRRQTDACEPVGGSRRGRLLAAGQTIGFRAGQVAARAAVFHDANAPPPMRSPVVDQQQS